MIEINKNPSRKDLIVFMWLFGAFLALIGYFCHRGGHDVAARNLWIAAMPLALVGTVACFVAPVIVKMIYLGWMYAAFPIGWTVTHLVLAFVFYGVVTPIGLVMKLFGYDPMRRTIDKAAETYWIEHDPAGEPARYFRQF